MTRISIVDDHELFAEVLDVVLTRRGHEVHRVRVADDVASAAALVARVRQQRPDVVVLDLDLGPVGDGVPLVRPMAEEGCAVMVVTASSDRARLGECLRLGAVTVLSKTVALDLVLERIDRVIGGASALPEDERAALLASAVGHPALGAARARLDSLSRREAEVLGELIAGRSVGDIARSAVLSDATVRTQVKAIRAKLGVGSQLAAVALALRSHWTPPVPHG